MPFLLFLLAWGVAQAGSPRGCVCTCVVKNEEGKYTTRKGEGMDREKAGDSLKKALGKQKCEISPDCEGSACRADLN